MNEINKPDKILIIDDEPIIQATLQALLGDSGFEFYLATSGEEGIQKVNEVLPDVILLDVMMPGMDGFEVCHRLKNNKSTSYIPIILITALDTSEDISRGLEAGADEFITKPPDRRELKARVRSMLRIKHQYEELEKMMILREDLTNLIIHDMRSPLNIIIGHGEILRNTSSADVRLTQRIQKINEQAEKLNKFINEILMTARMEEGKLALNCSHINVNEIIKQVVEDHHDIARARNIQLVDSLPVTACYATVDERLFSRALDNLVNNALKYSPPHAHITIELQVPASSPHFMQIRIIDQGNGIPDENKEDIFDKYKVVELKKSGVPQVGLGLFFCKLVIEAHGGKIWIEDNPSGGAIFVFKLPLKTNAAV